MSQESDSEVMSEAAYTARERSVLLLACCFAAFMTPLLSTMMNLSLISIGEEFGVGSHSQAYVNTAFLLSSVIFMVPMAKLADIMGKRRTFILGVLIILISSILASFSPAFWFLVACRACIGAGAAMITTTSISLITDVYPRDRRGGAIGMQTMCVYIGLAAGPPLGGVVNDLWGWHVVFWIVVPLALCSLLVMSMFRHEIAPCRGDRMDMLGAVLYGLSMVFVMGGVINLPESSAVLSILVGLVLLALFIRSQSPDRVRLFNISLFRNRTFTGSCMAAFLAYASSYSVGFFLALYLLSIGGLTSTEAGVLMLVQPAVQAVGTPLFGRLSDRVADDRILPTAGIGIVGIGIFSLMTFGMETSLLQLVVTMVILGFGFSVFSSPNMSVIMSSVPPRETSEASSMVSFMRQTGMMVSMGIAMTFISVIMGTADNLIPENYGDFLDVMFWSFLVCLAMCIAGMAASYLRDPNRTSDDE